MVVERSARACLLCGKPFEGRTFLCRECSDRYRGSDVPLDVRRRFYEALDVAYPERSNTFAVYNRPEALLAAMARLPRRARILEVGAGGGFLLRDLAELGFTNLTGSDITESAVEQIILRVPQASVVKTDASSLPFGDGAFDAVVSSDVIEHLPDVDRHLSEVARVLRPGGLYFIKTPNRIAAEAYYRLRGLHDSYFWHPSMFTASELRAALAHHGLEMCSLQPSRLTAAQLVKLPGPMFIRPLLARLPLDLIPTPLRPHLEVVARRST